MNKYPKNSFIPLLLSISSRRRGLGSCSWFEGGAGVMKDYVMDWST
jgi:hypothetical protein